MAKTKDYQSVRLPSDVVQMARSLASINEGMTISDLIGDLCRPALRKALEQAIKDGKFIPHLPKKDLK